MEFTERPQVWLRKLRSRLGPDSAHLRESEVPSRARHSAPPAAFRTRAVAGTGDRSAPIWRKLWVVSAISYCTLLAAALTASYQLNGHHFTYSLDDAYIHLSLARNWLRWHMVGISPDQVAMASSSPLWTTLLTVAIAAFGFHESLPLLLNMAASLAALAVFWWGWAQLRSVARLPSNRLWWALAAAMPLLLNLPTLSLCGMEHTLQATLVLAFVVAVWRRLELRTASYVLPCLLSCLLVLVRLESAILVGAAVLILSMRGQWSRAAAVAASAGIALGALCLVLYVENGLFLPNSVIIKGMPVSWSSFLYKCEYTLYGLVMNPLVIMLMLWALTCRRGQARSIQDGLVLCFVVAVLHVCLSSVSGTLALDRYESYILDLALLMILSSDLRALRAALTARAQRSRLRFVLERNTVVFGMLEKAAVLAIAVFGSNDVYLQQFQTARLVAEEFPHANVVANDIGLVSLRAGGNVTDLVGLGSTDVLHAVRETGEYEELGHRAVDPILDHNGADLIAIYPDWFSTRLYGEWEPVAAWSLARRQVTAGGRTVVFFARDPHQVAAIRERLTRFEDRLPPGVKVRYAGRDFSHDTDLRTL